MESCNTAEELSNILLGSHTLKQSKKRSVSPRKATTFNLCNVSLQFICGTSGVLLRINGKCDC